MRAVCFVNKLCWELPGTVFRHGLTIGDVDNDGENELVVGTAEGCLYIFKRTELWQKISGLGVISCLTIGDIFNSGKNALVVICDDGWVHIYYNDQPLIHSLFTSHSSSFGDNKFETRKSSDPNNRCRKEKNTENEEKSGTPQEVFDLSEKLSCVHVQRIPTNTKVVLVADIDKDGLNEMIIGLTDRVVRSYRWSCRLDFGPGNLVGLNKWECANQIGTVTMQHAKDGTPTLLVAQPGGTFMRINCNQDNCHVGDELSDSSNEAAASCIDYQTLGIHRMRNANISTEILGDLEPGKDALSLKKDSPWLRYKRKVQGIDQIDGNTVGGNVILGEYISIGNEEPMHSICDDAHNYSSSTILNNNNIISAKKPYQEPDKSEDVNQMENLSGKSYALATLDGTIMLVRNEIILWSMQVDHHIFALCQLDVTRDGADEIIACTWDGQTYILDQQRNSVRFQFEQTVRAFCTGMYHVSSKSPTPSFVFNTFNNKIFLYYDIIIPSMILQSMSPLDQWSSNEKYKIEKIVNANDDINQEKNLRTLTNWLLYGTH
ncbi:KICSTOR complex protein ITFG2-like [Leptopilina heterotoma]|uniref:KICSTOR complex protein ITFG2-like n=1 Tax=Leptopilina heterotoma TaxID=63436 RepID=UPI001CA93FC2|nr:KICSTOR complex protein ITFG2-like [Leptopilina heterotoma]